MKTSVNVYAFKHNISPSQVYNLIQTGQLDPVKEGIKYTVRKKRAVKKATERNYWTTREYSNLSGMPIGSVVALLNEGRLEGEKLKQWRVYKSVYNQNYKAQKVGRPDTDHEYYYQGVLYKRIDKWRFELGISDGEASSYISLPQIIPFIQQKRNSRNRKVSTYIAINEITDNYETEPVKQTLIAPNGLEVRNDILGRTMLPNTDTAYQSTYYPPYFF